MISKYIEYLKDNPEGFWFKRKLYGWGWTPVKWQGWAVVVAYIFVLVYIFGDVDKTLRFGRDTLMSFLAPAIIATAILVYICYKKGESPRWQWGIPKK